MMSSLVTIALQSNGGKFKDWYFVSVFIIFLYWKETNYSHNQANTFLEFSDVLKDSNLFQGTLWI